MAIVTLHVILCYTSVVFLHICYSIEVKNYKEHFQDLNEFEGLWMHGFDHKSASRDLEWPTLDHVTVEDVCSDCIPFQLSEQRSDLHSINLTRDCERDFQRFVDALQSPIKHPWALRMADATGKTESGILDGNAVFEGRYPQCIRAVEEDDGDSPVDQPIRGLYCLAWWYTWIPIVRSAYQRGLGMCVPDTCTDDDVMILLAEVYDPRVHELNTVYLHCERGNELRNNAEAIITIIILSLFGLAVCLATLCHWYQMEYLNQMKEDSGVGLGGDDRPPQDKEQENGIHLIKVTHLALGHRLDLGYYEADGNPISDIMHPPSCAKTKENGISDQDLESDEANENNIDLSKNYNKEVSRSRSTQDANCDQTKITTSYVERTYEVLQKIALSFSLYTNVPKVITTKQPKGAYKCLNGIRFLAMCWVILGHTYYLGPVEPVPTTENLTRAFKIIGEPIYSKIITADVYVDTFLILSAFLMTISFLKQLKRKDGRLGFSGLALHYFNRYWRLTPTYMIILMIYTNLFHFFAEGPFMREYIPDVDDCSEYWWRNLLYINNLFVDPDAPLQCFGWSWYLAVDMQLFVIAPLFLYILFRQEVAGFIGLVLGFCGGLTANIVLYHEYYTQPQTSEDPVNEYVDIYIKTWTRCPVYFMGMMLGFLFYKRSGNIRLPNVVVALGWTVAAGLYLLVSYLPSLQTCTGSSACGEWSTTGLVVWDSLFRPMWGLYVCWLILACANGYGSLINTFLSWNFFVPLGRLTYLGYLIHPILCWLFFFRSPVQIYYTDYLFVYLFFANLVIVNLLSLVMATVFSAPLTAIVAAFLPNARQNVR